jgi:hypothetical protein
MWPVLVKPSPLGGSGLFATRQIAPGEKLTGEYTGANVTMLQARLLRRKECATHLVMSEGACDVAVDGHPRHFGGIPQLAPQTANTALLAGGDNRIDAKKINAKYMWTERERGALYATKTINSGDEILVSYGTVDSTEIRMNDRGVRKPPTVLLAETADALTFTEVTMNDADGADGAVRVAQLDKARRQFGNPFIPCGCSGGCKCDWARLNEVPFDYYVRQWSGEEWVDVELTPTRAQTLHTSDTVVYTMKQSVEVTGRCVRTECVRGSTLGPYCPECLQHNMPHGSYKIAEQPPCGLGLLTLRAIEKDQLLLDIPFNFNDRRLSAQGHGAFVLSRVQLTTCFGGSNTGTRLTRSLNATGKYVLTISNGTIIAPLHSRSNVTRFVNDGGEESNCALVEHREANGRVAVCLRALHDIEENTFLTYCYGEMYWGGSNTSTCPTDGLSKRHADGVTMRGTKHHRRRDFSRQGAIDGADAGS